ncbi:MAG TPA: hypothetical protein VLF68_03050 [Candidatus Saccharimonadales bacterium]|nr:hypothetical protein [Candidatus Saccharimonadales bacterium]
MKQKDILLFIVPMFFLVVAWIVFTLYHSAVSSTVSETVSMQIRPIAADFDTKTINDLKKRQAVAALYTAALPSATPTPTPPSATSSAILFAPSPTPSPTPLTVQTITASQGGSLR